MRYVSVAPALPPYSPQVASQAEANFNSVERIVQYLRPEPEARPDTPDDVKAIMPKEWPSAGAISVQKLTMRWVKSKPCSSFHISGVVPSTYREACLTGHQHGHSIIHRSIIHTLPPLPAPQVPS
jgi:ATP-binding cassette subfamily C (CFTR/MRP) protein 1